MANYMLSFDHERHAKYGWKLGPRRVVRHSGHAFWSDVQGPSGEHVWPVDEFWSRQPSQRNWGEVTKEKVRKANPDGFEEGAMLRGYHPEFDRRPWMVWKGDFVRPKDFIKKHGGDAYRALPKSAFIKDGKRKAIVAVVAFNYGH
jgi:hypothetical protein